MSKAFRCDRCGAMYDGAADMQIGLDKQSEIIFRHALAIKFSPEMPEAQVYLKDLCNKCTKELCDWWKKLISKEHKPCQK